MTGIPTPERARLHGMLEGQLKGIAIAVLKVEERMAKEFLAGHDHVAGVLRELHIQLNDEINIRQAVLLTKRKRKR